MNFPGKKVMPRFFLIAVALAVMGMIIVLRALYIMTVQKDYWMEVDSRFQRDGIPVPPSRGDILADDGEVLAASIPEYKLFMDYMSGETDPKRVAKDQARRDSILNVSLDSICQGLHDIFPDVDPKKMKEHLQEGRKKQSKNWLIYPKRVSYIDYRRVKQLPLFRLSPNSGGFHVETISARKNPYGRLAARTVGDLYKGIDSARSGLELGMDSILRGKPGMSHRQKVMNRYLTIVDQPPVDGCDVQTTLNITMQDICEQALRDQLEALQAQQAGDVIFGTCILMEVKTGDVKAITSLTRVADGSFHEIQNKAVSNLMEPGSVFKPMSFLVAFNDGYLHLDDPVNTGNGQHEMHGRIMKDHNWRSGGYGTLTARQCIQKSSNVGVSTFIDRFYGKNPKKFVDGIKATGVTDDLHLPIPGYAKPRVHDPSSKSWSKTDLPWMSIGYVTQFPPISTLTFYNGIANNGRMMQPRFVKAILRNGEVVKALDPVVVREHMASAEAVRDVQTCLREVVTLGVGKKAASKLVHVAGKTGTAQVWTAAGRSAAYLVSFAGYFPYEKPQYSCIVCINKTGAASGGGQCGPVFRRVAEAVMAQQRTNDYTTARDSNNFYSPLVNAGNVSAAARVMDQLGLKYSDNLHHERSGYAWGSVQSNSVGITINGTTLNPGEVPNVTGYGLRDAVFCLERMGLKVRSVGMGRVTSQSLKPGTSLKRGSTIVLTLGRGEEDVELPDSVKEALAAQLAADSAQATKHPKPAASDSSKRQPEKKPSEPAKKEKKKEPSPAKDARKPAATKTAQEKPKTQTKDKPKSAVSSKKSTTKTEASAAKRKKQAANSKKT